MSQRDDSERLIARDQQIWYDYAVLSMSQRDVAVKHGLSQSQVSKIIIRQREALPEIKRDEIVQERVEQIRAIIAAVMPAALEGRRGSIRSYVELTEREAKLLGLDAPVQTEEKSDTTVRYQIEGLDDDADG